MIPLLRHWVVALCLSFSSPHLDASPSDASTHIDHRSHHKKIEKLFAAEFKATGDGSLMVGIVQDGQLVWTHSYGYADQKTRQPATSKTIYPIGSVTKLVTGIMLLQLVERGVVHLTDPVDLYVPEIRDVTNPFPWTPPITLMQLATMTAGFGTKDPSPVWAVSVPEAAPWDQHLLAVMPRLKYEYEPGTKRQYSNVSYSVLGLALSRAAGRPFTAYIQSEILDPLGMVDTYFDVTPEMKHQVAGTALGAEYRNAFFPLAVPAGSLLSTLGDLTKLMRFQLGAGPESVLSREALLDSYQLLVPSDGNLRYGDGVGFAVVRNDDSNLAALGHGGSLSGYAASYEFDRSTQCGVILLTNFGASSYKPLVRKALKVLHPTSSGGTGLRGAEVH